MNTDNVQSICLAGDKNKIDTTSCIIGGWGMLSQGEASDSIGFVIHATHDIIGIKSLLQMFIQIVYYVIILGI